MERGLIAVILKVNKLMNSHHECLHKLGWLIFNREDQNGGLSLDELERLLDIIDHDTIEEIYNDGYRDGLHDS